MSLAVLLLSFIVASHSFTFYTLLSKHKKLSSVPFIRKINLKLQQL